MSNLWNKLKIERLKRYIEATEREIRLLKIARIKYDHARQYDYANEALEHIEIRKVNLVEARQKLAILMRNEPETILFT